MKQRAIVFGGVVLAILVAVLLWNPWGQKDEDASPQDVEAPTVRRAPPRGPRSEPVADRVERAVTKRKGVSREERARYQRAIRQAMSERESKAPKAGGDHAAPEATPAKDAAGGEGLKDRSNGELAGLLEDFNQDVMPLADECYEQALERDPALEGGLNIQFEIIGDEEVGGLVESIELQDDSDIQDPEMIECMRETLLSTIFPAPDGSGSTGVELSLRFAPDEPK